MITKVTGKKTKPKKSDKKGKFHQMLRPSNNLMFYNI